MGADSQSFYVFGYFFKEGFSPIFKANGFSR
jgi:hypothetical protein